MSRRQRTVNIPHPNKIRNEKNKRILERNLMDYTRFVFAKIKKEKFIFNWHHKVLVETLIKIYNGELKHVIINMPPRYTKTELVVKIFISWCLAKRSKSKFIHLSYSDELALDNSSAVKEIIESEEYQRYWRMELKKDSKSKKKWFNEDGGGVYATSTGGQITGFGAGRIDDDGKEVEFEEFDDFEEFEQFDYEDGFGGAIIIDDPIKPDDVKSDTIRKSVNERFNNTIKSRVNSKETPVIVIMQRLHEEDMSGFLLDGGSELKFDHLNLPAINEEGPNEYDPRKIGEALWVHKHTAEELNAMSEKDPFGYAGQYQQRPSPADGFMLKREDIRFYRELPPDIKMRVHSWDMTFKKTNNSDYVVGTNWGTNFKDFYLIDLIRKKMSFTDTLKAMDRFISRNPNYNAILIEDKANGSAIIDTVKEKMNRVIPINPKESKEARFASVTPLYEAGNVYLPHPDIAPWVNDFIDEHLKFPNAKHDDQVDSGSQALNYLSNKTNSSIFKLGMR